jgi:hypothetical protein
LFRRRRITVNFLRSGTKEHPGLSFRDGQAPVNHSWWITEQGAWAISNLDHQTLYEYLLKPPPKFFLSLLHGENTKSHLHLQIVNAEKALRADTPLAFTVNNTIYFYSVYELEEALTTPDPRKKTNGKSPGVRELLQILGTYHPGEAPKKKERGRPTAEEDRASQVNRIVREDVQEAPQKTKQ